MLCFLCRPEEEGANNSREPEDDPKNPEYEGDRECGDIGVCEYDEPKYDREEPQDTNAPSLAGEAPVQGNKSINQGEYSHHDGENKRHDEGAVQGVGKDQETEYDTKYTEEDFQSSFAAVRKSTEQGHNTAKEPVKPKEPDDYRKGPYGIHEQETTQDKCKNTLDEQEPPWEERSHRVRSCFSHFS